MQHKHTSLVWKTILLGLTIILPGIWQSCDDDDDKFKPGIQTINGKVEKGPFISGSRIFIQPMNEKLQAYGELYTTTIKDHTGTFTLESKDFQFPYIDLTADGYFFNEVTGKLSDGTLTLKGFTDFSNKRSINVNILTHLKYYRIQNLIKLGISFEEANKQAQNELLTAFDLQEYTSKDASLFSITEGNNESAVLVVISSLLLSNRTEAELTEYLATLSDEFGIKGTFSEESIEQFKKDKSYIKYNLSNIENNIINRYKDLGIDVKVKDLKQLFNWDTSKLSFKKEKQEDKEDYFSDQTLLMYMPWSGNLTSYFRINLADMKEAISYGILKDERVLVFFATSPTQATLYELTYNAAEGSCEEKLLKEYQSHPCTTAEGITSILNDVKTFAPADLYSMTIGGHGMGWLPVNSSRTSFPKASTASSTAPIYHWEAEGYPLTRYFGGTTSNHQTDITTLAKAIKDAGLVMEYILFDDCYMSCIEVAYDLRYATRHLIASTCEVMAYGMPYMPMAEHLLRDTDYEAISQTFHDFYMNYSTPCGTIATTVTAELDSLATLMHEINARYTWNDTLTAAVQYLDGYSPHLFYDLGHYASLLCTDSLLLQRFNEQLERAVPSASRSHTPTFYSMFNGRQTPINHFSGITISDPSTHHLATPKNETNWYKATHTRE